MAGDDLRLELLAWSGCPSHPDALTRARSLLDELGRPEVPVEVVWVETDEEAHRRGFVGSPSLRVDGRELLPPPPDAPVGLACRVYRTRDGRYSPLPDPDDLREAMVTALAARPGPSRRGRVGSPARREPVTPAGPGGSAPPAGGP